MSVTRSSTLIITVFMLLFTTQAVFASQKLDKQLLDAVLDENTSRVEELLKKGANANSTEVLFKNRNIMGWASQHKSTKMLEILISFGGDVNMYNEKDRWSPVPIYNAFMASRIDNLKLILKHGANVNVQDNHQQIPYMAAVSSGDWHAAYLILAAGTHINFINKWGNTPQKNHRNGRYRPK